MYCILYAFCLYLFWTSTSNFVCYCCVFIYLLHFEIISPNKRISSSLQAADTKRFALFSHFASGLISTRQTACVSLGRCCKVQVVSLVRIRLIHSETELVLQVYTTAKHARQLPASASNSRGTRQGRNAKQQRKRRRRSW